MVDDEHSMLARLDERMKHLEGTVQNEMAALRAKFVEYVRLERYRTIEFLVFGVAGLILSGVFAAIIATVLNK